MKRPNLKYAKAMGQLNKSYDDTCSYCGESHPQHGAICPTYEQHKADDAQAEKELPTMKTTDNKPIDLHAQNVQERNNYLLRALAAEAQRDDALAALRDIIRYSEQPMGAIESHAIWAQARAVIAASQGS